MKCTRCNRPLKHVYPNGMGPRCAQAVLGTKPKRERTAQAERDQRTADLFEQVAA